MIAHPQSIALPPSILNPLFSILPPQIFFIQPGFFNSSSSILSHGILQGVSKKRTDHYLMIAQLLKHPQKKLRPFSKSPFRGLLENVQNLYIWAYIGRDIQGMLKASQNWNFKFVGYCDKSFCFFFFKQNGSHFIMLSFHFFVLEKTILIPWSEFMQIGPENPTKIHGTRLWETGQIYANQKAQGATRHW